MHVNPQEAVQIHLDIHAKRSIGMHWGTFPLTAEPVIEPVTRLAHAVRQANLPPQSFTTFKIGETRYFDHCRGKSRLVQRSASAADDC
jgi:L-ascorbate metabolism protein UlaG (beta-lactamase superfamily)